MSGARTSYRREPPGFLLRLGFKLPELLYHGPLATYMKSRCVMLMTTTGRKSGLPRTNGVSFMRQGKHYISFVSWGMNSNWYKNLLANPEVTLQVGRQRIQATAEPITDPDEREQLMRQMEICSENCGPPKFTRPLLRLTRTFDYDADIALAVKNARELPVVRFIPKSM